MTKNRHMDEKAVLRAALSALLEQAYQMRGMFDDSDGAIATAIDAAQDALYETAGTPEPATGETDGASEPVRVLVVLNGGCVSDVWASAPVKLEVFDWDDHDEDEGMEPQHEVDALRVGLTQVY